MTPKARAWLEDYKELLPVCSIDFVNDEFCVLPYAELEGGGQITVKGLDKLEWFTGLQDNRHKDIYEGDIIDLRLKGIYTVNLDIEQAGYVCGVWCGSEFSKGKIIGNIHEGIK